jgi:uncharacterized protein (DUF885 family)
VTTDLHDDHARAAEELAQRYWERLLELDPIFATQVGEERLDDRMPDPSDAGVAERAQAHRAALADLEEIDRSGLDETTRTTLDMLEAIARRELEAIRHRTDRFWAVNHFQGPGELLANLATLQRADTPERADRYLARMRAMPAFLDALGKVADDAAAEGQTVPALVVDRAIGQVERLLALDPAESPAMEPLGAGLPQRAKVADVLRAEVWPAYERYLAMLRRYRPHARESIGLIGLPDGDAIYASEILAWTTLPLDAEEVHRIGLQQLEATEGELRAAARDLGFDGPAAAVAAHRESGRDTAFSRGELLRVAEEQVQKGWEAAPRAFGRLPARNCEVRQVEEFREQDTPAAYYMPPSGDGSRPGIYFVNTSNVAERHLHFLASVSYHEANPGHHFQLSLSQEFADRPPLRRFGGLLLGASFIEGWGLYAERLADELGLYADEYERLGMLAAQGWRAARLVVDTGIHALGWDRERAIQLLMNVVGGPRMGAEVEVDRYIAFPAQALSYKLGQLEIERWRAAAEGRLGPDFSLPDFHDRLLSLGSLPLPVLERELAAS